MCVNCDSKKVCRCGCNSKWIRRHTFLFKKNKTWSECSACDHRINEDIWEVDRVDDFRAVTRRLE